MFFFIFCTEHSCANEVGCAGSLFVGTGVVVGLAKKGGLFVLILFPMLCLFCLLWSLNYAHLLCRRLQGMIS